ncbi:hypothetical protein KFE98_14155 [bacterium SCSIO 12741]|nr:hypothetical protein KFE98_14155 [bacterium SCSIO 12741]
MNTKKLQEISVLLVAAVLVWLPMGNSWAQSEINVTYIPQFAGQKLSPKNSDFSYQKKPLKLSKFRCYVSGLEFLKNGKVVWKEETRYFLLDAWKPNTLSRKVSLPPQVFYDQVRFQIGVDSLTNVSGAYGGDLDPTLGMYWTWNSGYINFKLEGKSELCTTRKNRFQYHIGGYLPPYSTAQSVTIKSAPGENLEIGIYLDEFLSQLNLTEEPELMIPGQRASELATISSQIFRTSP